MTSEEPIERPVGLFDMDGTLFAYTETLERDMRLLKAPEEPDYTLEDLFDESKPWLKARMDLIKSIPGWWRDLPLLATGMTVYNMAVDIGYEIEFLTKGPRSKPLAWAEKVQALQDHFGPDTAPNIVGKGKGRYYGTFLCDDYESYMRQWLRWRPRGLGILIGTKANAAFKHENIIRFDDSVSAADLRKVMTAAFVREPGKHWRDYL